MIRIEERDALAIHARSAIVFGGASGLRDIGLLNSALARPKHVATYSKGADLADLAAAYTHGIVKNHPFVDGNKRTGFIVGVVFLELNGRAFIASEEAATTMVLNLASGGIEEGEYASFLRANMK